jgi:isoquinoline 1-oxidoreductase beta subunit
VTEISLDARARVHIDRVVFVLDCGITINPDLIRAQVEGGLLFGLSAAAWGEVLLGDGGEIVTQNFDRYPIMRMRSVPSIEVPSAAPALTNAIAALTGTRVRQLPINNTVKIA